MVVRRSLAALLETPRRRVTTSLRNTSTLRSRRRARIRRTIRVLHVLWNGEIGGAERAVCQLIRAQEAHSSVRAIRTLRPGARAVRRKLFDRSDVTFVNGARLYSRTTARYGVCPTIVRESWEGFDRAPLPLRRTPVDGGQLADAPRVHACLHPPRGNVQLFRREAPSIWSSAGCWSDVRSMPILAIRHSAARSAATLYRMTPDPVPGHLQRHRLLADRACENTQLRVRAEPRPWMRMTSCSAQSATSKSGSGSTVWSRALGVAAVTRSTPGHRGRW